MRWNDYVLVSGDDVGPLVRASGAGGRATTLIVGSGFDPRGAVGPRVVADVARDGRGTVVTIGLPPGPSDAVVHRLAAANAAALQELVTALGWRLERLGFPEAASRRAAGQVISRQTQSGGFIDPDGVVIVDVSALPASVAFPIIGGVLAAHDRGTFQGQLLVLVCENPAMDSAIREEGADDPGPLSGLNFGLTQASDATIRAWAPVLGEHQAEQLAAIHAYLEPDEITPILPFPAANPRRADDLIVELRPLLFERMGVEPGNMIYAHEANPFDVYRALWRLSDRFARALQPLGRTTVVTSVHGSKLLSIGALLAAWECKLPVVTCVATGYLIGEGADLEALTAENRLMGLWLLGEPYR